jgi:hypothetical protein
LRKIERALSIQMKRFRVRMADMDAEGENAAYSSYQIYKCLRPTFAVSVRRMRGARFCWLNPQLCPAFR